MRLIRLFVIAIACIGALLPAAVFADSGEKSDGLYNFMVVWAPLVLMVVWFVYIFKKYGKSQKRALEHMDRSEKLLERIADALEKNQKSL